MGPPKKYQGFISYIKFIKKKNRGQEYLELMFISRLLENLKNKNPYFYFISNQIPNYKLDHE